MNNEFNKYIPNILSIFRFSLVLPFVIFIHDIIVYNCANLLCLIIYVSIILSDVLDGHLARKLRCASETGAKLDIVSDAFYVIASLAVFVYFEVIPLWFLIITIIKLCEFMITSRIIKNKYKSKRLMVFDKAGKTAVIMAMIMPGIFVFRCIITEYKITMHIIVYVITLLFIVSFFNRMILALKPVKAE